MVNHLSINVTVWRKTAFEVLIENTDASVTSSALK